MTKKQEKIVQAALELFALEGYAATSTRKVAEKAGVSEGLIFRHFKNKDGLLAAILEQSMAMAKGYFAEIVMDPDPKSAIRKTIELPFAIKKDQYEMWRLTYALKWQTDQYNSENTQPVKRALQHAFEELGYPDAEAETELLLMFIDGAATSFLLHPPQNQTAVLAALKAKYKL